jgi:polar amino acid transport system permease protein
MTNWLNLFIQSLPVFMQGALVTLELTVVGICLGFVLGVAAALGRIYGSKWVRRLSIGYIELFRGTPLLVQLFLLYYGLPGLGITLSRYMSAFLALGLNSGAYQAEYLRGAILAIGDGQMMAGRAIGMSKFRTIWYIILPQALRLAIPSWANEPIGLLKSSAVVFLIAVPDLMTRAKIISAKTYDPIGAYIAVAVVYLVIVFLLNEVLKYAERKAKLPGFELEGKKA